jgi:hypothetical protein
MELVEGPTLADRLTKGAVPPDEALPIAQRIAEGSKPRTTRGSSTGISNRRTSSSGPTAR